MNGGSFKIIFIKGIKVFFFLIFIYFIFGCVGSSVLHAGFLQLWRAGATLIAVRWLLIAVASLVAKHGL